MDAYTALWKGKGKMLENNGDKGQFKPPLKCMVNLDFEEPHLEIWRDTARRRGGHYQHLQDAPHLLRDLIIWLESVEKFEVMTKLKCRNFAVVCALVGTGWAGRWTPKALQAFQAVANCTGIMHPPRNQNLVRTWRTHGGEVCSLSNAIQPRQNVNLGLTIPPSLGKSRKFLNLDPLSGKILVTSKIPTPPVTPLVRPLPFGRVHAQRDALRIGCTPSRAHRRDGLPRSWSPMSAVAAADPFAAFVACRARGRVAV